VYAWLLDWYRRAWKQTRVYKETDISGKTKVTVVIPARNEEENIGALLSCLKIQTYPASLFEIMVVDDFSTDKTTEIVKQSALPNLHLLQLADYINEKETNSFKKQGIALAISKSSGELIVTTDADCLMQPDWLSNLVSFYEKTNAVFIAAPVRMPPVNKSLAEVFQALDFAMLQGITAGSVHKRFHTLCNGANLAYGKKVFEEVNGFAGIDNIASGDDMLLMHKIFEKHPKRVHYLLSPAAVVTTSPVRTWAQFFSQRIRWASKGKHYRDNRIKYVLLLVYLLNLASLALMIIAIIKPALLLWVFLYLVAKTVAEAWLLWPVTRFYQLQKWMIWFPFLQPLHIFYTVVAGWLGLFGKYKWKGRETK
jgi:cellulose synthase/poly-beta-1,6-N-acetylglucosamine synthase-like glycosyltransferase